MTFQYFFFDTYVGDFLQVVPVALLAGAVCLLIRGRLARGKNLPFRWPREIALALFVCYLAGLWGLVLTPNNLWDKVWYFLFHHQDSGNTITWLPWRRTVPVRASTSLIRSISSPKKDILQPLSS